MRIKSFKNFNHKFLLVNFRSPKVPQLHETLNTLGYNTTMITWDELTEAHLIGITGIILSGSPNNLSMGTEPYLEKYSFLKETEIPVLGICFGHQVIGVVFGGEMYRGDEIKRDEQITLLETDPLLSGLTNPVTMRESHSEGVNIPSEFISLGESASCSNEIMKHKSKTIYGVQFHPEMSGENGELLLKNFYDICTV